MHCGAGRVCHLEGVTAKCICIPECPDESDVRRRVCTNKNETWPSDCSVYQQRCLCDNKEPGCLNPANTHLHIDYYGECHELKECTEEDMKDFPRRVRDWLFNVMRDLAERDELTEHYMQMELEAETNMTRRWANAAVWKWCDLDGDTDRSVSRHELFPIRAPLISLEHCIAPFLESCDPNNDHRITLVEWGACLGLEPVSILTYMYNNVYIRTYAFILTSLLFLLSISYHSLTSMNVVMIFKELFLIYWVSGCVIWRRKFFNAENL